jgi:hypothetical protein
MVGFGERIAVEVSGQDDRKVRAAEVGQLPQEEPDALDTRSLANVVQVGVEVHELPAVLEHTEARPGERPDAGSVPAQGPGLWRLAEVASARVEQLNALRQIGDGVVVV